MENKYICLGVGVLIIILIILYIKKEPFVTFAQPTIFTTTGPENEMIMQNDGTISLTASLPIGSIIMWNNIKLPPSGWSVCDGSNGTPNLQGKYIIGASPVVSDIPDDSNVGQMGGSSTQTLSLNNIPAHNHAIRLSGSKSPSASSSFVTYFEGSDNDAVSNEYATDGGQENATLQTNPTPISIVPPYYTMTFIMKMK